MKLITISFLLLGVWSQSTLLYTTQVTSEGFRTGLGPHPLPGKSWWPGQQEITPMGLRQQYLVGYDLAESVITPSNFSRIYSPHQIQIRSTNENVTLMGA